MTADYRRAFRPKFNTNLLTTFFSNTSGERQGKAGIGRVADYPSQKPQ